MGLRDLFKRWSQSSDKEALEQAEEETRMSGYERAIDSEDYEARKDDVRIGGSWAGSEALGAENDE